MLFFVVGCGPTGPATVPVSGTLTIGGQPANNVGINLVPTAAAGIPASGNVENGAFTVFSGNEGKPGAMVGKYKVVLYPMASAEAAKQAYGAGGAKSSAAPVVSAPFPDKYRDPSTSDKEIEITGATSELKIEIPAE